MHLQENTFFDLWVKVTQNVAQYPLHNVTYAATKFEVAICLFVLLLYVPSQQLWSLRDGQFT